MEVIISIILPILLSLIASGGFWGYVQKKQNYNSSTDKLLLGLGHTELIRQSIKYLEHGYLTDYEYEDYVKYLYEPYIGMGGNSLGEKFFKEVSKLPIKRVSNNDVVKDIVNESIKTYRNDTNEIDK